MKRTRTVKLSRQVRKSVNTPIKKRKEYDGNFGTVITTGSTLLDLAISGGMVHGGGLPGGILVEIFGPSGSGKTVLLSEIAGEIQRLNGEISFFDPEARLNKQFAKIFDLNTDQMEYSQPDTVTKLFIQARKWEPKGKKINGLFADSLAALSTEMEMEKEEGDKMGMRRAKEFSEQLRKTCRVLVEKNYLMVCSNQVRVNIDAGTHGQKYSTPGGESIGFYSSLRLRTFKAEKITKEVSVSGKKVKRAIGVRTRIEVFKSSIWKPYRTATVSILFDYGIDNIRENLQYIKDFTKDTTYIVDGVSFKAMNDAIKAVEDSGFENKLREQVITLWEKIEGKFETQRKIKQR